MISTEQLEVVSKAVRGYVNGINDVALRAAIETVVEEYVRDIGGISFTRTAQVPHGVALIVHAPNGGQVNVVDRVFADGEEIPHSEWKTASVSNGGLAVSVGNAYGDATLTVTARWLPTTETDEIPDAFFREHAKAFKDGALAFLLSQAGRPWGDQATAARFMVEFDKDKYDARRIRMCANENGNQHSFIEKNAFWL